MVLHDGVPPLAVVRVVEAGLAAHASGVVHLHALHHARNGHLARGTVSGVLEERFHHLRHDPHAALAGLRDDHLEDVLVAELGVVGPRVPDEGVLIVLRAVVQVGPALERHRGLDAVVRKPLDFP